MCRKEGQKCGFYPETEKTENGTFVIKKGGIEAEDDCCLASKLDCSEFEENGYVSSKLNMAHKANDASSC